MSKHTYKNGQTIKAGDKVTGPDWRNLPVEGEVIAGEKPHHKPFALKRSDGVICPSLDLKNFMPVNPVAPKP